MSKMLGPRSARALVLGLALVVASAGCSGSKDDGADKKKKQKKRAPAQVDLPDPPPASALEVEEMHSDGTFRVEGLIATQGKHLGDDVEVKGHVSYLSPECDPRRAAKKGKECPKPYLTINDGEDAEAQLMVVGYTRDFLERAELEEGKTYVFDGTYKKLAQGFVASESGLILLNEVNGEKVVEE